MLLYTVNRRAIFVAGRISDLNLFPPGLHLGDSHKNISKNAVYLRLAERSDSCSMENIALVHSV